MELTAVEIRILGCLVEKQATTPDAYPLTTNALVAACSQKTNRDPVVDYDERTVDAAMLELRTGKGLARTITGGRANKHRHVLDEVWGLEPGALALLAVLMLRGPQTPGELRSRTERMHEFADTDAVEGTLRSLTTGPDPFVEQLARRPGQKEQRWRHLLGDDAAQAAGVDDAHMGSATAVPPAPPPASSGATPLGGVDELRAEVSRLRVDVDRLYRLLGESPE